MKRLANNIVTGLLDVFYPQLCAGCGRSLTKQEAVLCMHCLLEMPTTNFNHIHDNILYQKISGRTLIQHAAAYAYFSKDGMLQHLIHQFKYQQQKKIGTLLGELFANEISDLRWVKQTDVLVPIPLHRQKFRKRGFNQSHIIATAMGTTLHKPVAGNALIRIINNPSQTNKSRSERLGNVKDIFAIEQVNALKGKNVLLVDDILTTGATMETCSNLLRSVAASVSIAVLGIATG